MYTICIIYFLHILQVCIRRRKYNMLKLHVYAVMFVQSMHILYIYIYQQRYVLQKSFEVIPCLFPQKIQGYRLVKRSDLPQGLDGGSTGHCDCGHHDWDDPRLG